MTFYNGFLPNFARLGSWNCAMFLTVEQVGNTGLKIKVIFDEVLLMSWHCLGWDHR